MIKWLSNYMVYVLLKNEIIETEKIRVYQYGYEIILSTIITFIIVLISGIILNCLPAALLYFLIFAVMRQICGGYHAKYYWSCNTLFTIVTASVLLIFKFFPMETITEIHYTFLIFSVLVVFAYAPVENVNKPISEKQKAIFRIISRITVVSVTAVSCSVYSILKSPYTKLIDFTLMAVAVSILVGGVKERRINNEEYQEKYSEDFG